jgi:hypothetical protein
MYNNNGTDSSSITIRAAQRDDRSALVRVAQRDSAPLPDGELLVAAEHGEIRAAISIGDGTAIADPFHRTAELVRMLTARAEQLRASAGSPDGELGRLLLREAA